MRNAQMEGVDVKRTPSKGKVGSFCIFVWSVSAGQPLYELGLEDNPFKVEVFRMIYV